MTARERFDLITRFQKPDRCVRWYTLGFWPEVAEQWHQVHGLPQETNLMRHFQLEYPVMEVLPGNAGGGSIPLSPPFEEFVIAEEEDTRTIQEATGIISKVSKKGRSMPHWLSFPVKTASDWERIKYRIDPATHDYGAHYAEEIGQYRQNDDPNGIFCCGIYAFHRNLFGTENLSYAYYDQPNLLRDISQRWLDYYAPVCERLIRDMRIDFILFHEDMAYKTGPLVGPNIFREFMTPFYREMIQHLQSLGQKTFMLDCDGNLDVLLPLFTEVGINALVPFEQASGNDLLQIRKQYPELVMWGGIDKRVLNGTKDDIQREVSEKVATLWEQGGYIPGIDHSTPPCPMENFLYYLELLEDICG